MWSYGFCLFKHKAVWHRSWPNLIHPCTTAGIWGAQMARTACPIAICPIGGQAFRAGGAAARHLARHPAHATSECVRWAALHGVDWEAVHPARQHQVCNESIVCSTTSAAHAAAHTVFPLPTTKSHHQSLTAALVAGGAIGVQSLRAGLAAGSVRNRPHGVRKGVAWAGRKGGAGPVGASRDCNACSHVPQYATRQQFK
jgi:hypothetical protein